MLPRLWRISFHLPPWHFLDSDKEHMKCDISLEHTVFFSLQKHRKTFHYNICKCTSILSNTQCVQFGIMCLWKTDFCSYLCCVLFFPHLFIYCVYGSHPFLRPLIYSYVHTLDTFNYLEILFFCSYHLELVQNVDIEFVWTEHHTKQAWNG